jgi:polyisoprenoid-binding protein YceI
MGVIKEERDGLDRVLRRYQATGTIDAVLAEVDGAWSADLGPTFSPVSPTSPIRRRRSIVLDPGDGGPVPGDPAPGVAPAGGAGSPAAGPATAAGPADATGPRSADPAEARRFALAPDRSVVMIEVRSSVGPITFGAVGLTGWIEAVVGHGVVRPGTQPKAHVEIAVDGLRSGNSLYDAELLRRIDARRFPIATLDLRDTAAIGTGSRYRLGGELEFHGVTRAVNGSVDVMVLSDRRLRITGEQEFDIRDYDLESPTVLMLRIYPDVRVHLHVEAEPDG